MSLLYSDKIGKELVAIITEINKWFDYYHKNSSRENRRIALEVFLKLDKMFFEYAGFKRRKK